jgi:ElaB/YqjD/DUF883 family membrane-anchored ribosome-binding protein
MGEAQVRHVKIKTKKIMKIENEAVSQLAENAHELIDSTAAATDQTVVEARNRLKSALAAAGETYEKVKAKAVQGAQATDKAIRENPYQAIGIAFGVGAVLGYLLSRRSSRD